MKKTFVCVMLLALLYPGCTSSTSVSSPTPTSSPSDDIPGLPFPLPSTVSKDEFQPQLNAFLESLAYRNLPGWRRDKGVRDTGPFINGVYYGTHPAVRCYYSPEVFSWMKGGRVGPLPDGAMIVKEMYNPPAARYAGLDQDTQLPPPTWTVMIKDSGGAFDGWYWAYSQPGQATDSNEAPFTYPNETFGAYCLQCHTSANGEFTFASLDNVEGEPGQPLTYFDDGSWKSMKNFQYKFMGHLMGKQHELTGDVLDDTLPPPGPDFVNPEFVAQFTTLASSATTTPVPIPGVTTDHTVADAHRQFVSADQCMSCHAGDSSPFGPNMFFPNLQPDGVDVSPFGEAIWSMMGLAGRDPIFHAQLESERAIHSANGQITPEQIQNLCFTCHGVMGERQLKLDHPEANFLQSMTEDPNNEYGKLGREGISCALCHQIQDYSNQPLTSVQTGNFPLEPRTDGRLTINGPYDSVATLPMEKALNAHPRGNSFVQSSVLCSSCHTVFLPVLDDQNNIVDNRYEQTTFLEWANSSFRDDGPTPRSCQSCHMPDNYFGQLLNTFKIANVQDQTYPFTSNLSPIADITVQPRTFFRRHVLLGINQYALEMFQHFPSILGISKVNFMSGTTDGLTRAIENAQDLTVNQSATVQILSTQRAGNVLTSVVKVTNLTGHRFPSGVGFRRAFLAFEVKDGSGNVVWLSGRTDGVGVLLDSNGQELPTEFHQGDTFQPHYTTITTQDQVQIYEEVVKDLAGHVTTSFLSRANDVKDNRLMPLGWTFNGPPGFAPAFAEATAPVGGAASDPNFIDGTGSDTLTYQATLPGGAVGPFTVRAELYYQAIPPYYLQDRFTQSQGPATKRLYHISAKLDTRETNFPDWKLPVANATGQVP